MSRRDRGVGSGVNTPGEFSVGRGGLATSFISPSNDFMSKWKRDRKATNTPSSTRLFVLSLIHIQRFRRSNSLCRMRHDKPSAIPYHVSTASYALEGLILSAPVPLVEKISPVQGTILTLKPGRQSHANLQSLILTLFNDRWQI